MQQAAERGSAIIVNASKYACDALIVLRDRPLVHVPFDCSLDDVTQLCSRLSELIQDPHVFGENRESRVKKLLRDLWTIVVEPIATVLQDDVQLPLGSRIWWCPTSKFKSLPLHAAGLYGKGKENLMDLYTSSYAPSLSALIRARERAYAQKEARGIWRCECDFVRSGRAGAAECTPGTARTTRGRVRNSQDSERDQHASGRDTRDCHGRGGHQRRRRVGLPRPPLGPPRLSRCAGRQEAARVVVRDGRRAAHAHVHHPGTLHALRVCVLVCVSYGGGGRVHAGRGASPRSRDAVCGIQWGDWDVVEGRRCGRARGGHPVLQGDVQTPGH